MAAERGCRQCMPLLARALRAPLMALAWSLLAADLLPLAGLFSGGYLRLNPQRESDKQYILEEARCLKSPEASPPLLMSKHGLCMCSCTRLTLQRRG